MKQLQLPLDHPQQLRPTLEVEEVDGKVTRLRFENRTAADTAFDLLRAAPNVANVWVIS